MRRRVFGLGLACAFMLVSFAAPAQTPSVVASIAPVHSLVAGVMQGVAEPALVVRGYASPHTYQMRPSDAARLAGADVVFWVGEALETFLGKPLASLAGEAQVVALLETEGLTRYPYRSGGIWRASPHGGLGGDETHRAQAHAPTQPASAHEHAGEDEDEHTHEHADVDAHIWLDPDNAVRITAEVARVLSAVDPAHASRYRANGERARERIRAFDERARARLEPVRGVPYVVFHDAFQYLERHYGLNAVGAITVGPERMPSARRVRALRARMEAVGVRCAFREPQFESSLLESVLADTGIGVGVLDPLGTRFEPGPDGWFRMMEANVDSLVECLSGS